MPASFGVQGPGEMTIASGRIATTSSTLTLSFRRTVTLGAQLAQEMDEVVGEAVVVIDDEDHSHGLDFERGASANFVLSARSSRWQ